LTHPQAPRRASAEYIAEALEHIMTQQDEFRAALDEQRAATVNLQGAVTQQIQQVADLAREVANLAAQLELERVTPQELADLKANTAELADMTARLVADDQPPQTPTTQRP